MSASSVTPAPIIIEADERPDGVPVRLVGEHYTAYRPKTAVALQLARIAEHAQASLSKKAKGRGKKDQLRQAREYLDTMVTWIDATFAAADAEKIKARLNDARDALDLDHVGHLMEALNKATEEETGNPTM